MTLKFAGFSALQRAENSSIKRAYQKPSDECPKFQCSSASRKFLNYVYVPDATIINVAFQCSSASRKFLNSYTYTREIVSNDSFSALQRAENSSISECVVLSLSSMRRFSALQRAENSSITYLRFYAVFPEE